MRSVDFYILDSTDPVNRLKIACRLSEKAWHGGYRTFILTESTLQQKQVDDLLWTFRAGSFVPHAIFNERVHPATPVILGNSLDSGTDINLIINLSSTPVDPPENVERIIEIIDQNEKIRVEGRERYRHYQKIGKTVRSHRISV